MKGMTFNQLGTNFRKDRLSELSKWFKLKKLKFLWNFKQQSKTSEIYHELNCIQLLA